MEYVMVPVPDEYVVDVMQYVARLVARASVVPWTKEAVEEFFEDLEEIESGLAVASWPAPSCRRRTSASEEAAEALELSEREIRAITREINEAAKRNKYEPLIGSTRRPRCNSGAGERCKGACSP